MEKEGKEKKEYSEHSPFFTKEYMEDFHKHKGDKYAMIGEVGFRHGHEKAKKLL